MNIVISYNPDNIFIAGLTASLQATDDEIIAWLPEQKPVYDMIDEAHPDILFMDAKCVTRAAITAIQENPQIRLVLFGLSFFDKLKPELICLPDNIPDKIIENIDKEQLPYISLPLAANVAQYNRGQNKKEYHSDILYISNVDPTTNPLIMETLTAIHKEDLNLKICGKHKINLPEYLGRTTIQEECDFMASTNLAIDFDHYMLLNYIANKVTTYSNKPYNLDSYTPPSFSSATDFMYLIEPAMINYNVVESQNTILKSHTYFHRLHTIFTKLDIQNMATRSLETLKQFTDIILNHGDKSE